MTNLEKMTELEERSKDIFDLYYNELESDFDPHTKCERLTIARRSLGRLALVGNVVINGNDYSAGVSIGEPFYPYKIHSTNKKELEKNVRVDELSSQVFDTKIFFDDIDEIDAEAYGVGLGGYPLSRVPSKRILSEAELLLGELEKKKTYPTLLYRIDTAEPLRGDESVDYLEKYISCLKRDAQRYDRMMARAIEIQEQSGWKIPDISDDEFIARLKTELSQVPEKIFQAESAIGEIPFEEKMRQKLLHTGRITYC